VDKDLEKCPNVHEKGNRIAEQRVPSRADQRIDRQRTQTTRQSFDLLGLAKPTSTNGLNKNCCPLFSLGVINVFGSNCLRGKSELCRLCLLITAISAVYADQRLKGGLNTAELFISLTQLNMRVLVKLITYLVSLLCSRRPC
jgi:hypothetical protein